MKKFLCCIYFCLTFALVASADCVLPTPDFPQFSGTSGNYVPTPDNQLTYSTQVSTEGWSIGATFTDIGSEWY
jgi:opacity protein-like surface antigen